MGTVPAPAIYETVTALKAVDAAADLADGQKAIVLGVSAYGDCPPFVVKWVAASSSSADDFNVFRPSVGDASSGNGRWLRSTQAQTRTFSSGDATPSIANGGYFITAGSTAITDFDDAFEGQAFTVVRGSTDITITHNASVIDCAGYNIRLTANRPFASFVHVAGVHKLLCCDILHDEYVTMSDIGGKASDTGFDNAGPVQEWAAAALAGTAPTQLVCPAGAWYFSTQCEVDDLNILRFSGIHGGTRWLKYFNSSDEKEAVLRIRGNTAFNSVESILFATAPGFSGGCGVCLYADSDYAPSEARLRSVSFTTYTTTSSFAISGFTNASEGVITTSGSHGLSNGTPVCLNVLGGTFQTLEEFFWEASDVAATTLKLKQRGTSTYADTTSLGSFASGTIRKAECFDYSLVIFGTNKNTGATGVRVVKATDIEMFGGGKGAIKCEGVSGLEFDGTIFPAGFSAYIDITGTSSVPSDDVFLYCPDVGGFRLDYVSGKVRVYGDVTGGIFSTSNTPAGCLKVFGTITGYIENEGIFERETVTRAFKFSAAGKFAYGGTGGVPVEADITAAGRALLDDASASVQRATLAVPGTDVDNTFTGENAFTGGLFSYEQIVSDDTAWSFSLPAERSGLLFVWTTTNSDSMGVVKFRVGAAASCQALTVSALSITTGALAGTTGSDGAMTVSVHTDDKIYIENRRGGTRKVSVLIMHGATS